MELATIVIYSPRRSPASGAFSFDNQRFAFWGDFFLKKSGQKLDTVRQSVLPLNHQTAQQWCGTEKKQSNMKKVKVNGQVFNLNNTTGFGDKTVAKHVRDFITSYDSPAVVTAKENGDTITVIDSPAKNEKFRFLFV